MATSIRLSLFVGCFFPFTVSLFHIFQYISPLGKVILKEKAKKVGSLCRGENVLLIHFNLTNLHFQNYQNAAELHLTKC